MKNLRVRFRATMYTTLEVEETVSVPEDSDEDAIDEILYRYQRDELEGGEYTVVGESAWDNIGYEVVEEAI